MSKVLITKGIRMNERFVLPVDRYANKNVAR